MTADELKVKIGKMETALKSDSTPESVKPGIEKALATARGKLAELAHPPKVEAKKVMKKDYYAAMDKIYKDLTQAQVSALKQADYEAQMAELEQAAAKMGVAKDKLENYAYAYVFVHLPKGEQKTKAKPSPVKADEIKPSLERPKVKTKPVATPTPSAFNWRTKVDTAQLKPIVLHCQHYVKTFSSPTRVSLKGSGTESIQVMAQKGEHLIFDDKGYPVFVMNAASFTKKCNEGTTVDQHEALKHQQVANTALKKELSQAKAQLTSTTAKAKASQETIENLKAEIEKAKKVAQPAPAPQPKAPKATSEPKPTPSTSTPPQATPKPKRAVCSLDEAETGRRLSRVIKFFMDEAQKWNESKTSRKITKIMRTKGQKQEIIIEVADYAGLSGLTTFLGNRKYYRLCIDSFKMDKVEIPARGSYSIVVREKQMKQVYTTRGEKQYLICLKSYRELLKCSFEGSCTTAQSQKWKTLYKECGDLVQKLEKQPKALRLFHTEVKSRRKAGELYSEAMSRVAGEIKKDVA